MLDTTMLQIMGLMDHPKIIEMERQRIQDLTHLEQITAIVKKCMANKSIRELMSVDPDLAELFIAAEVSAANEESK